MRGEPLAREAAVLAAVKKMALFAAGVASQRFMTGLEEQQEIMADLADMISQVYALESALLRAQKIARAGRSSAEVAAAMTGLLADETMALAEQAARRVLAACGEGDALHTQLAILRRLARFTPADVVALEPHRGATVRSRWSAIRFRALVPILCSLRRSIACTIRSLLAEAEGLLAAGPHAERARRDAETLLLVCAAGRMRRRQIWPG